MAAAGPVDLLVHAAGMMDGTFVRKESVATFDAVISANLRSSFLVSRAVLAAMPAGGRIVFVSSSSAHQPQPGKAAYTASKAGLNAYALALALEVERDGIAVHTVTPAPVATPMLDDVHFPMHTLTPEQVADAIVWLETLDPSVVLPEIELRAVNVGPFVAEPLRARGRPRPGPHRAPYLSPPGAVRSRRAAGLLGEASRPVRRGGGGPASGCSGRARRRRRSRRCGGEPCTTRGVAGAPR